MSLMRHCNNRGEYTLHRWAVLYFNFSLPQFIYFYFYFSICKICQETTVEVIFHPCAHEASCIKCAKLTSECPLCHKTYTGLCRTYMDNFKHNVDPDCGSHLFKKEWGQNCWVIIWNFFLKLQAISCSFFLCVVIEVATSWPRNVLP